MNKLWGGSERELLYAYMLRESSEKSEKSLLSSLNGFNGLMNNVSGEMKISEA